MVQRLIGLAAVSGLAVLAGCVPAEAPQTAGGSTASGGAQVTRGSAADIGAGLNGHRRANGRSTLTASPGLARAAQKHADYLASTGRTGHTGRGGSSVLQRVTAEGYRACLAAENLSYGYPTTAQVVAGWKASSGHNRNMLDSRMTHYGVGQAGAIWVLVLAQGC